MNNTISERTVPELVANLGADNPVVREQSRQRLVEMGGSDTTRALVAALMDPRAHVRWEAAKALQDIADPVSAPALMHTLDDDNEDVRWVAGEALVALREAGLRATLSGLTKRAKSFGFCHGAHHVLSHLKKKGHASQIDHVLAALEQSEPQVTAPPAAYQALVELSPQ